MSSSSPSSSNSNCKNIKFCYNDNLNDLRMTPENNIFGIDSDKLRTLLAKNLLFEAVGSVAERLSAPCDWPNVASSSDDSSDDNEIKFLSNKSSVAAIEQGKTGSQPSDSDRGSTSSDKKERNDSKQPHNSETKNSALNKSSYLDKKHISSNNINDLNISKPGISKTVLSDLPKSADSEKTTKKQDTSDSSDEEFDRKKHINLLSQKDKRSVNNGKQKFNNKDQNSILSQKDNRRNNEKHTKKKSEDNSESADLEAISGILIDKLSVGDQPYHASKVKKRIGHSPIKVSHELYSKKFVEQPKEKSINLSHSMVFEMAHKRQNKIQSKKAYSGSDEHKFSSKKEQSYQKLKKQNFKHQKFKEKPLQKTKEISSSACQLTKLLQEMLKKRVSHGETDLNKQEVGFYCKICSFTEHSYFENLNHFNDFNHLLNNKVHTVSNYYCSTCKLIICCEHKDSLKEDHPASFLHTLMEKNLSKELPIRQKQREVDTNVIKKFNCILLKSQVFSNIKSSLVPYESTEESSSDEDQIYGELLTNSARQPSGNPLASVWVFPLKMESDNNDEQHWVKFIGIAGGSNFHPLSENLDLLKDYGAVNQCLIDLPSNAVYVPFKKWSDVQKVQKAGNKFMNEHKLQPVTMDLLGRAPGKGGNDCSALLGNKQRFIEMITLSVNSITKELDSVEAITRLINLKTSIGMAIEEEYPKCVVFEFGSRVSGLSSSNSDFDLFVDLTGQMYWGKSGPFDEAQFKIDTIKHIQKIQKILKEKRDEFTDILGIVTARVPILRFTHIPTDSHCDLSFRNGLCVENTKLISKYVRMNCKIRWVIIAVKYWAQVCDISSSQNFTTYSLTWMVLFYLMTKKLIPSVSSLMNLKNRNQQLIQGWKFETTDNIGDVEILESEEKLLQGFFGYYAHFNFNDSVICPRTGSVVQKSIIEKCIKNKIPDEIKDYVNYIHQSGSLETNVFDVTVCCVQDPFLLSHNITRQVRPPILKSFRKYCDIANIEMLLWSK